MQRLLTKLHHCSGSCPVQEFSSLNGDDIFLHKIFVTDPALCFADILSPDAEYVDLLLNPERYTGYKGPDAWKIWNSIYEENCFK